MHARSVGRPPFVMIPADVRHWQKKSLLLVQLVHQGEDKLRRRDRVVQRETPSFFFFFFFEVVVRGGFNLSTRAIKEGAANYTIYGKNSLCAQRET